MSTHAADRNLLFGILALQMDFISRDMLVAAMNAWVLQKSKPLGEILLQQGALEQDNHALLEALVTKHLAMHGNDPQRSLAAVSSIASVREDLHQLADPDVAVSLRHVSADRDVEDPYATRETAVGTTTSSGLRFRFLRPHARGGLGQVSVAEDAELHREVALKEIQIRHADDIDTRSRFVYEAEITGNLEHPGIVPVYGLGQYADGRPYYAMRFIRGDSLKDAIKAYYRTGPTVQLDRAARMLELRKLLGRFIDVCDAIGYAHSRGVLHRDLKPGNIMLGKYGETLVVDWGLAKPLDPAKRSEAPMERSLRPMLGTGSSATQFGSAVGTPAYMSPEQAAGLLDQLGPASDVYSLGATLYSVLTGKAPLEDPDLGSVLRKVQRGEFPRPRQINPMIDPALEAICLTAMALQPENRYASPRDLADDLEHWLADEPVSVFREPMLQRMARWGRRHKSAVAGVAGLLVTAVLGLSIGTLLISSEQARTAAALRKAEQAQAERALAQVDALLTAEPASVAVILDGLHSDGENVLPRLQELDGQRDLSQRQRMRVSLALLPMEPDRAEQLRQWLLSADPQELLVIRKALLPFKEKLIEGFWNLALDLDADRDQRLRAACALAAYDPDSGRWSEIGGDVADALVAQNPLHLSDWMNALQPVQGALVMPLSELFRDREKSDEHFLVANILATYAADDVELLGRLIQDADKRQYGVLLEQLKPHRERAIAVLEDELAQRIEPTWDEAALNPAREQLNLALIERLQSAQGLVAEQFAVVQSLPLEEFAAVAEQLRTSEYRPRRLRPYPTEQGVFAAALWKRDGREWRLAQGLTTDEVRLESTRWRDDGYLVEDVAAYPLTPSDDMQPRYVILGIKQDEELDRRIFVGLTAAEHTAAVQAFTRDANTFALIAEHEFIGPDGQSSYCSVWSKMPQTARWQNYPGAHELLFDVLSTPSHLPTDVCLNASPGPPADYNPFATDLEGQGELEISLLGPLARGMANYGLGKHEEAIADLTEGINKVPVLPQGYAFRALAHARLGHAEQARTDLVLCDRYTAQTIGYSSGVDQRIEMKALLEYARAVVTTLIGDQDAAFKRMESLVRDYPQTPLVLFTAAQAYALAAELVGREPTASSTGPERYAERGLELLQRAVACGFANANWELQMHPDLNAIRDQPEFAEIIQPLHLERRYTCAWYCGTMKRQFKCLAAMPAQTHLAQSNALVAQGYRPQALSVAPMADGELYATSVWIRPVAESDQLNLLAQRQASAALTLLQLGKPDHVWSLLHQGEDPRQRSYLMHRFETLQPDPQILIDRLSEETEVTARRALLLTLGSFDVESIAGPARAALTDQLLAAYLNDPDAGIHSAVDWLLRRWGLTGELQRIDRQLVSKQPVGDRDWYLNGQGQTLAVVRGPVEFAMGSPLHEDQRQLDEVLHQQRISRSFALATKETTASEFLRFRSDAQYRAGFSPGPDAPIIDCTWYEAAQYCRWLSEQEGVPEDQMCYPPVDQIGPTMQLPHDYLDRTGYRLPTEAEFEYGCRAGTETAYFFGDDVQMLSQYVRFVSNSDEHAWPVGQLKPNDLGLFDVLGNVGEWCQGPYMDYARLPLGTPADDVSRAEFGLVVRSGSWMSEPFNVRCARRFNFTSENRSHDIGFRVARTLAP